MNSERSPRRSRLRDFALYIAIGVAFGMVAFFMGRSSMSLKETSRWLSLIFFSAILYGTFIALNRPLYRTSSFWALTAVLLALHSILFIAIVMKVEQWRPIWSAVMFFEAPLLDALKSRFVSPSHRSGKHG